MKCSAMKIDEFSVSVKKKRIRQIRKKIFIEKRILIQ